MIASDFRDMVRALQGGNLIDVEISDPDIDTAFNRAKTIFIHKGNNTFEERYIALDVVKDQSTYDLSSLVDENNQPITIHQITEIVKPTTRWTADDPFSIAIVNDILFGFTGFAGADLVTYDLTLQLKERLDKYSVNNIPYTFNRIKQSVTLFTTPKTSEKYMVHCYLGMSDDEYRDVLWIQQYTQAEVQHMIGLAYRKFSSLSTPAGELSLDGDQLVQEANTEKERLLREISEYTDGPAGGGVIISG